MRLAAFLLLLAPGVWAQSARVAPVSGFPKEFVRSVGLSLADQPFYGSQLLNGLSLHLRQVSPMPRAEAVRSYLEAAVAPSPRAAESLRAALGKTALEADQASALLLANGLARPEQFREIVEGLEGVKPGLGFGVSNLLKEAAGASGMHPEFARLLSVLGEKSKPVGKPFIYDARGRLSRLFDGTREEPAGGALVPAGPVGVEGYAPVRRPSGLLPAPKSK